MIVDKVSFLARHSMLNCKCRSTCVGKFAIEQPNRNLILSQNCYLFRSNPFSTIGSTNNQFDTSFSRFILLILLCSSVNYSFKCCKMLLYCYSLSTFSLLFRFETSDELTLYNYLTIILKFSYSNFIVL